MLDPQTYRASEQLAKTLLPSWRIAQTHNLDVFEKVGFPVRIGSVREIGQIIDTMQENRFERYMAELGGLSADEYRTVLDACVELVWFQLTYLPHRQPLLPVSTLLSAYAIYKKMKGASRGFRSVLEVGPGCGYVSLFLRNHEPLENYSQIEACESFYILQNLVNLHCFGPRFEERALPTDGIDAVDYFSQTRVEYENSPTVRVPRAEPRCVHYPWWRVGELLSRDLKFDIVTSNANLLEFSPAALNDYLVILQRVLKPDGVFLVQCTGFDANGTVEGLLDKLHSVKFAPLMFVRESVPASFPGEGGSAGLKESLADGVLPSATFTTNNAVFVRAGHPLYERYYERKNYHLHFIAQEPVVRSMFFERPGQRRSYSLSQFIEDTEAEIRQRLGQDERSGLSAVRGASSA
jgi:SAM-dependent methyltransferase